MWISILTIWRSAGKLVAKHKDGNKINDLSERPLYIGTFDSSANESKANPTANLNTSDRVQSSPKTCDIKADTICKRLSDREAGDQ